MITAKRLTVLLILVCFMALGAAADVQAAPRQLKINTISATGSIWHQAMQKFAAIVKEKTNGDIEVLTFADGQLGNIPETLAGMQLGSIEMGYFGLGSALYLKDKAKAMHVMYVPYLFNSKEDATRILNSPVFQEIYDGLAKGTGVRIFGAFGDRSPRAIQTTKGPIMKPEDLKGLKLRVAGMDIFLNTFRALGVKCTPLPMTEIYMGLKQHVIEGQDNGFDLAVPLKFHEVAKYWSATDHSFEVTGWFISEKLWKSLTDKEREIFVAAAKEAGLLTTELCAKLDQDSIQTIKDAGGTYTVPDVAAFKEALKDVYKTLDGKLWPAGTVEKIRAMQK